MKILDIPSSGACGQVVAFQSRFGLCLRERVVPRNTVTPARQFMRGAFGHHSQVYSRKLSQEQLERWNLAGARVMSDPRLGQCGPLTGQQLYESINSVRSRVNAPETWEPPVPVVFSPSAVRELVITNDESGFRMLVRVSGELNEEVMVFGQEPCSSGRFKRRNVAYLGLLPPPIGGMSDIIHLYRARYGEPRPGTKVFIVTCQQKNGWKGIDQETSAVVPDRPKGPQAGSEPATSQNPYMHKGSTRDVEGTVPLVDGQAPGGAETETRGKNAAGTGLEGGGGQGGSGST